MKAWEAYKSDCDRFWGKIANPKKECDKNYDYDYIVPVARKACKLISVSGDILKRLEKRIRYKEYFPFTSKSLKGKKVAVVDDSVQHGSALAEYRRFFEKGGAKVDTYAFVGHQKLLETDKPDYQNLDPKMDVTKHLPEAAYYQYLLKQSLYLISQGVYQDIDHLVIELMISNIHQDVVAALEEELPKWGYAYGLYPLPGVDRFGLHRPTFFNLENLSDIVSGFSPDFVEKLRFSFSETTAALKILPMVFPKMAEEELCQ
jgi:hypothetical protein